MPKLARLPHLLLIVALGSGCAIGTTPIGVNRSAFEAASPSRQTKLLVTTFVDGRDEDRRAYIGAKRNGYGMVLGHVAVPEGQTLEGILTQYFAEALETAGYTTAIAGMDGTAPDRFDPVAHVISSS